MAVTHIRADLGKFFAKQFYYREGSFLSEVLQCAQGPGEKKSDKTFFKREMKGK